MSAPEWEHYKMGALGGLDPADPVYKQTSHRFTRAEKEYRIYLVTVLRQMRQDKIRIEQENSPATQWLSNVLPNNALRWKTIADCPARRTT